jgi:hypothetical protein
MFQQFTNQQFLADRLKCLIDAERPKTSEARAAKRRALEAISRFERCPWHPLALELALDQVAAGEFSFDTTGEPTYQGEQIAEAVIRVVDRYAEIMGCGETVQRDQLYGSKEAAAYLDISLDTLKYHAIRKKNLKPFKKLGHDLAFTREQLDEFKRTKRQPGRPPSKHDGQD